MLIKDLFASVYIVHMYSTVKHLCVFFYCADAAVLVRTHLQKCAIIIFYILSIFYKQTKHYTALFWTEISDVVPLPL